VTPKAEAAPKKEKAPKKETRNLLSTTLKKTTGCSQRCQTQANTFTSKIMKKPTPKCSTKCPSMVDISRSPSRRTALFGSHLGNGLPNITTNKSGITETAERLKVTLMSRVSGSWKDAQAKPNAIIWAPDGGRAPSSPTWSQMPTEMSREKLESQAQKDSGF